MASIIDDSIRLNFPTYSPNQDITIYSKELGAFLHRNEFRQNGIPYFDDHSKPIAEIVKTLEFHPQYEPVFISLAYLHDVIENNLDVKISSPYGRFANRVEVTSLNDLFPKAKKPERQILYCVNRITDKYPNKFIYMNSLLNISKSGMFKLLDLGTLVVKTVDIFANNANPTEVYKKKDNSIEESEKAKQFLAKKLRNLLHMKYEFLPKIKHTLLECSRIRINSQPLYVRTGIEKLMFDIDSVMNEFLKRNPPMEIVLNNHGLGEPSKNNLPFYSKAFEQLSKDFIEHFNYYSPKPLQDYMLPV